MKTPNRQKLAAWTDNDQEIIRFVEKLAANDCCAGGVSGGTIVFYGGSLAVDHPVGDVLVYGGGL